MKNITCRDAADSRPVNPAAATGHRVILSTLELRWAFPAQCLYHINSIDIGSIGIEDEGANDGQ